MSCPLRRVTIGRTRMRNVRTAVFVAVSLACCAAVAQHANIERLPPSQPSHLLSRHGVVDLTATRPHDPQPGAIPPVLESSSTWSPDMYAEEQLPPVAPQHSVISSPPMLSETLYEDPQRPIPPQGPPGARPGIFQKLSISETWLPGGGGGGLGMHKIDTSVVLGFPQPSRKSPLLIRPQFNLYLLDGPVAPDLPAELYDAKVQFRWMRPVGERWIMDIAVAPGYHADFKTNSGDALRITGHGLGLLNWSEQTKVALGIVYLDRTDLSLLPAFGIIYTPHDDARWELIMPRPRVAWRPHGWCGPDDWLYIAGEFGSGTWAITRASGAEDVVNYSDYRLVFGWERKPIGQLQTRLEFAYVFGREVEYESATPDFEPNDTVMLRMGLAY